MLCETSNPGSSSCDTGEDCQLVLVDSNSGGTSGLPRVNPGCATNPELCGWRCVPQNTTIPIGNSICCPNTSLDPTQASGSTVCKRSVGAERVCQGGDNDGAFCNFLPETTVECPTDFPVCKKKPGEQNSYVPQETAAYRWSLPYRLCVQKTPEADVFNRRSTTFFEESSASEARYTDYCGVAPEIPTIVVNRVNESAIQPIVWLLGSTGDVNLEFTVRADPNQLPLRGYRIDWSDGNQDVVSGTGLRDRSNPQDPYILSHLYNYSNVLSASVRDEVYCSFEEPPDWWVENYQRYFDVQSPGPVRRLEPNQCAVRPKIFAIDNWGFCTGQGGYDDSLQSRNAELRVACSNRSNTYSPTNASLFNCPEYFLQTEQLQVPSGEPMPAFGFSGSACSVTDNPHVWVTYGGVIIIQQGQ